MTEEAFTKLLKPDRYQVFLFVSRGSIPLSFAVHPWFVVNKRGIVSRYEITWTKHLRTEKAFPNLEGRAQWGHLYKNFYPPWCGLEVFPFSFRRFMLSRLLGVVEGGEGSLAAQMAAFIERESPAYRYTHHYSFFGPNSNTYAEWILNHFPDAHLALPWNAFGKHFAASIR